MSSTAVLERAMGRRLTPLERLAISTVLAALFHLLLLLFLEAAVGLSSLRPRTYLGSVTVELDTEAVPELVPETTPEPTQAVSEPQATPQVAARTEVKPATQPSVEPVATPRVEPKATPQG